MTLQKLVLKSGINRENTRYTNENGWYECDKVRFRQNTPEKIGGWQRISANTFLGVCRSLWNWVTLAGQNLLGIGTTVKFYIENGGSYYDVTPIRAEDTLTNPFTTGYSTLSATITAVDTSLTVASGTNFPPNGVVLIGTEQIAYTSKATNTLSGLTRGYNGTTAAAHTSGDAVGSYNVTVTDAYGGFFNNDYVTFYNASAVGGITVSGEYQLTYLTTTTYSILTTTAATSAATGGGTVYVAYQVTTGSATYIPQVGWGAGPWGTGPWGIGNTDVITANSGIRIWNQVNWGQDLIYGPRGGPMYYWNAAIGYTNSTVTMTIASPCVVTSGASLPNNTALTLTTTGALPTGLVPGVTYYTRYITSTTFYLSATSTEVSFAAACSGSGANTLTVTEIYSGTIVSGMTVIYLFSGSYLSLGTLTFTGSGSGGVGTYTVSAGVTVTSQSMTSSTLINTSGTQSGIQAISPRGILLSSLAGADGYTPLYQNTFTVSDTSRFVIAFGTNDYGSTVLDPMLIRWSDQESLTVWYPAATNQAGSLRLSHGSKIVTTLQSRQEIVVWTDSSLYSLQYLSPPVVWGSQLLADNVSIAGPNAAAMASGVTYWMGVDKFYKYDGRVQTLRCDLRQYVYSDINEQQFDQVFASTNEGFNEVWFFYCSKNSNAIDKYVIYNYFEDIWQYGTMARTAWLDTGLRNYPLAATYSYNIVNHEYGVDNNETGTTQAITATITSAQFDIGDGQNLAFVWRMLPDLTFRGSTSGTTPALTMQLLPLLNSGSGYNDPKSVGGTSTDASQAVTATQVYPIDLDTYNGQIYIRIRGRQMAMRITSNQIGTQWQLGSPRIDLRPDGRR
jgi:hypothetical protein